MAGIWCRGWATAGAPLVLVAHMDTVWPAGTLPQMPFRVEGGYAWGPGALDMKAGIVTAIEALPGGLAGRARLRPDHRRRGDREPLGPPDRRGAGAGGAGGARPRAAGPGRHDHHVALGPRPLPASHPRSRRPRRQRLAGGRVGDRGAGPPGRRRARAGRRGRGHPDERRPGRRRHGRQRRRRRGVGADRRPRVDGPGAGPLEAAIYGPRAAARGRDDRGHRRGHAAADGAVRGRGGAGRPGDRDRRRPRDRALRERVAGRLRRQLRGGRRHARASTAWGRPGSGAHAVDERVSLESLEERTSLVAALVERL